VDANVSKECTASVFGVELLKIEDYYVVFMCK